MVVAWHTRLNFCGLEFEMGVPVADRQLSMVSEDESSSGLGVSLQLLLALLLTCRPEDDNSKQQLEPELESGA